MSEADVVNLRSARKRRERREREKNAEANRTAFGLTKHERSLAEARRHKADKDIDAHRIEEGNDR